MKISVMIQVIVLRLNKGILSSYCLDGKFNMDILSNRGLLSRPNGYAINKKALIISGKGFFIYGGESGIRTLGRDKPTLVFKTSTFGRSVNSPRREIIRES